MKKLLLAIIILLTFAGCGSDNKVQVIWDAPSTGSEVAYYVLEIMSGVDLVTYQTKTTNQIIEIDRDITYYARVAAVGTNGVMGSFSETSDGFVLKP